MGAASPHLLCAALPCAALQGYKAQNRAMEGDEVVIRILPPEQWYQLTSAKQAEEQKGAQQAQQAGGQQQGQALRPSPAVSPTGPAGLSLGQLRGNVVPAAGLPVARAPGQQAQLGSPAAAPALTPAKAGAAEAASPPAMTPPAWAGEMSLELTLLARLSLQSVCQPCTGPHRLASITSEGMALATGVPLAAAWQQQERRAGAGWGAGAACDS